jgi:hypothetical protein
MPPVRFERVIRAGERPQTYALDRELYYMPRNLKIFYLSSVKVKNYPVDRCEIFQAVF